jgi:very-short-patch-repair endonuclease
MQDDWSFRQELIARARAPRRSGNAPEVILWELLKDRRFHGFKFRRQSVRGQYITDFSCFEARLAVEIGGSVHRERWREDAVRDEYFRGKGRRVLRIQAADVHGAIESVLIRIHEALRGEDGMVDKSHPVTSPACLERQA